MVEVIVEKDYVQKLAIWVPINAMKIAGAKVCLVLLLFILFFSCGMKTSDIVFRLCFTLFCVFRLSAFLMMVRHYLEALFPGRLTWKCGPYGAP